MVERPLPFFGAGTEAFAGFLFIVFLGTSVGGLISYTFLASLFLGGGFVYLIRLFREVDPYGVEAFVVGVTTPSYFYKGYVVDEEASEPYTSFPTADPK